MTPGPCPGITSVDQARGRLSVAWNGGNQVGLMPEGEYAPTPPPRGKHKIVATGEPRVCGRRSSRRDVPRQRVQRPGAQLVAHS